ncbi:hypothetical protein YTPLAS18_18350 [Nitrospira sp.]|nr:hypothetical protein YTPLAS18_18350 [Nitrospira sp.]
MRQRHLIIAHSVFVLLICGAAVQAAEDLVLPRPETRQGLLSVVPGHSRYFVDRHGQPVYLSGSHTHCSLQHREGEPPLPFESLLAILLKHGHNFTKLWRHEDTEFTPQPFRRVGAQLGLDGRPKFDLTKWNDQYFDELRSRVMAAEAHGIYISIMLFNGFSVESKQPGRDVWSRHPFNRHNNINGLDGDLDGDGEGTELHTLRNPAITAIHEAYVRRVIDVVSDLDNVFFEISNEDTGSADNTAWQYHLIDYIHHYERTKSKQHLVGMAVQWPNGNNQVLYDSPADWISPNANEGYQTDPPALASGKVILNDTDHLWGNGGSAEWVWKSFTRGLNPIFMDVTPPLSNRYSLLQAEEIRQALGETRALAQRIDLARAQPRTRHCSTSFCLVNPGREYLAYLPPTRWCAIPLLGRLYKCRITLDLSDAAGQFAGEWFNTRTRATRSISAITGGTKHTFIPPFGDASVLYLSAL